jgi:hypothetical protein
MLQRRNIGFANGEREECSLPVTPPAHYHATNCNISDANKKGPSHEEP